MLEAKEISFTYPGTTRAIYEDFSASVAPGERVGLCAPSGFGKTTLCKIFAGYLRPQKGRVYIDGVALDTVRGACPVQLIGQHPERAFDSRLRMKDSLAEAGFDTGAPKAAQKNAPTAESKDVPALGAVVPKDVPALGAAVPKDEALLEALGIKSQWLSRYPHELSGGELMRFCIARALMTNPRYLIADEISSMLDALTSAELWKFLLAEIDRRDMGLIFVSHSPALRERIATRTVVL